MLKKGGAGRRPDRRACVLEHWADCYSAFRGFDSCPYGDGASVRVMGASTSLARPLAKSPPLKAENADRYRGEIRVADIRQIR